MLQVTPQQRLRKPIYRKDFERLVVGGIASNILTVGGSRVRSLGLSLRLQCNDHRREPLQILRLSRVIPS